MEPPEEVNTSLRTAALPAGFQHVDRPEHVEPGVEQRIGRR